MNAGNLACELAGTIGRRLVAGEMTDPFELELAASTLGYLVNDVANTMGRPIEEVHARFAELRGLAFKQLAQVREARASTVGSDNEHQPPGRYEAMRAVRCLQDESFDLVLAGRHAEAASVQGRLATMLAGIEASGVEAPETLAAWRVHAENFAADLMCRATLTLIQ